MLGQEDLRFLVHSLDVGLEHLLFNAPLTSATDLDRGQLPVAYQGIGLRGRDVECLGYISKGEKPKVWGGHRRIVHRRSLKRAFVHKDSHASQACGYALVSVLPRGDG